MKSIITIGATSTRAHIQNDASMTLGEFLQLKLARPAHQRKPKAWKKKEKADLVKVGLAAMGVPNFFVRVKDVNGTERQTIEDGLQRTTNFLDFVKGKMVLPKDTIFQMPEGWVDPEAPELDEDMEMVGDDGLAEGQYDGSGKRFDELPEIIRDQFYSMPVVVSYMYNFSDEQAREFFQMLQQGTPLNATEIRNAQKRAISSLLGGLTSSKSDSSRFFQHTGTQAKAGAVDRMKDVEQALSVMTVITADEDNFGLTKSRKDEVADSGYTRNSEEYTLTQDTLVTMADIMDEMEDEDRKLVKSTVIPPLARVISEMISKEEDITVKTMASDLTTFLKNVNDGENTDPVIARYRDASVQGASSNAQMKRRIEIIRKAITA
jgi:hypothetical protein